LVGVCVAVGVGVATPASARPTAAKATADTTKLARNGNRNVMLIDAERTHPASDRGPPSTTNRDQSRLARPTPET
jgi:hypothetical protein